MELEHKGAGAGLALADGVVVSGYASLFDRRDAGGDSVAPGAYAKALAARAGGRLPMLWQHDPASPIGLWEELREDGRGLWVKGRLLLDVARGREAAALLAAGVIDGLSIGYRTKRASPQNGGRRLEEIDLWEVSLVTFPMQAEARIAGKAQDDSAALAAAFRAARISTNKGDSHGRHIAAR